MVEMALTRDLLYGMSSYREMGVKWAPQPRLRTTHKQTTTADTPHLATFLITYYPIAREIVLCYTLADFGFVV